MTAMLMLIEIRQVLCGMFSLIYESQGENTHGNESDKGTIREVEVEGKRGGRWEDTKE
jgi:hypothetical protein